jgi:hypothetical protein
MLNKLQVESRALELLQAAPPEPSTRDQLLAWVSDFLKRLLEERPEMQDQIVRRAANDLVAQIVRESSPGFRNITSGEPKPKDR